MNNQTNLEKYFPLVKIFGIFLTAFVAALFIYMLVLIANGLKEGRYIGKGNLEQNSITVSGSSEVYAKPDLALVNFSVISEGKTVAEATNSNSEKMNKIIENLKKAGMDAKDLKTTNFSVNPRYEYSKSTSMPINFETAIRSDIAPIDNSGKRTLAGYDANQTLSVKIRNTEKAGAIIDTAISSGANQMGDLQFTIDNTDALKDQVRAEAIAKAKEKAAKLASQLKVKLVRITSFNDNSYYAQDSMSYSKSAIGMGGAAPEAARIEAGENKIESNITITYEIE